MPHYNYLVIGGGMTADAAVQGIREVDKDGTIGVISMEPDTPYNRTPLTKALWKGEPLDTIWRHTDKGRAQLHLECKIEKIEPEQKRAVDGHKNTYTYDKLLLATGG